MLTMLAESPDDGRPVCRRGTSNSNDRGSSYSRRRRREWLVETFRADTDALVTPTGLFPVPLGTVEFAVPVCRCYRCGALLTVDMVTVDRIVPGCEGGTYRRGNIRPACGGCNSTTGGLLAASRRRSA